LKFENPEGSQLSKIPFSYAWFVPKKKKQVRGSNMYPEYQHRNMETQMIKEITTH
jgi:hypothetical protein